MTTTLSNLQQTLLVSAAAGNVTLQNTVNQWVDALFGGCIDKDLTAEPSSPTEGDLYILPSSPTGDSWGSFSSDDLALYLNGAWTSLTPTSGREGLRVWVNDEDTMYYWTGGEWVVDGTEKTTNKDQPDGYAGLNENGEIEGPIIARDAYDEDTGGSADDVPTQDEIVSRGGAIALGDGATIGGQRVAMHREVSTTPDGYLKICSIKTSNLSIALMHDGADSASGICYSVDGGTPVYTSVSSNVTISISVPHNNGAPIEVYMWPATSSSSGRVGNITRLTIGDHDITAIDLTGTTELNQFTFFSNQIKSLEVKHLSSLTYLNVRDNNLEVLDVSGLTNLTTVLCYSNNLTVLTATGCTSLTALQCNDNNLTTLDVSGLPLEVLECNDNNLTTLDVSEITTMTIFDCSNNALAEIIAINWDGAYHYHSMTGAFYPNLENNQMTTDAVYSMLEGSVTADPATILLLDGNPCEVADVLQDGTNYTAAQLTTLAASKNYGLQLN